MGEPSQPSREAGQGIVARPPGQLHDYPIDVRWEVTRRHPYYLTFWSEARKYRLDEPVDHQAQALLRLAAAMVLGSIGVSGEPISPATDSAGLMGEGAAPMFLTGSVQPLTLRAFATVLLRVLPQAEREAVARCLVAAGDVAHRVSGDDEDRQHQASIALSDLARLPSAVLDSCLENPIFFIHMGASQRSIVRDIEEQVRLRKAKSGLGSSKVQTANLGNYLAAWDLREGWTGGGYDLAAELTFAKVASRLGLKSTSTAAHHYRSAFEMITGHPFSPELWWRLFGPLKYSQLLSDPAAILSAPMRRYLRSPAPRPVPDSRVSPAAVTPHGIGVVEAGSAVHDDFDAADLLIDLKYLINRGLADEEIAGKLDLADPGLIAQVRSRIADFGSI